MWSMKYHCSLVPTLDVAKYSLSRALRDLYHNERTSGLEGEVSAELAKVTGLPTTDRCVLVPTQFRMSGLDTNTNSAGKYLVPTDVPPSISDALRGTAVCLRAGAEFIGDLSASIQFPIEASATTGSWIADNPGADVSQVDATFSAIVARPHGYLASTSVTRQLLLQASPDIESYLARSIGKSHALALDAAALCGPATAGTPLGITGTSGVQTLYAGTNGATATADLAIKQEKLAAVANAHQLNRPAYVGTPEVRAALRESGYLNSGAAGVPVWMGDSCNGSAGFVTNALPKNGTHGSGSNLHSLIFGYFDGLKIAEWGVMQITLDRFTKAKQGLIEISSLAYYDVANLYPAAFVVSPDIIAS